MGIDEDVPQNSMDSNKSIYFSRGNSIEILFLFKFYIASSPISYCKGSYQKDWCAQNLPDLEGIDS